MPRSRFLGTGLAVPERVVSNDELSRSMDNDLQPAALSLRPDLQDRLDALIDAGALGAAVSGSGPTCFGLFDDRAAAEAVAAKLDGAIAAGLRPA